MSASRVRPIGVTKVSRTIERTTDQNDAFSIGHDGADTLPDGRVIELAIATDAGPTPPDPAQDEPPVRIAEQVLGQHEPPVAPPIGRAGARPSNGPAHQLKGMSLFRAV